MCAPAGAGKTTLIAQLALRLRDRGDTVGWLRLEPDDNDVGRLMRGILSAVAEGSRRAGSDVADELARLTVPADPVDEGFLESMAETLSRSALPLWLLLDDAHVLALAPRSTRWGESWISWVTGSGRFSPADGVRRSHRATAARRPAGRDGRIGWPLTRPRRLTCLQPIASCSTTVIWRLSSTEPRVGGGLRLAALSLSHADDPGSSSRPSR